MRAVAFHLKEFAMSPKFGVLIVLAIVSAIPSLGQTTKCAPGFPLEKGKTLGWEGADAAYSIPLHDGRDVWIFGDTLYGKERVIAGHDPQQVHNSLGISTCDATGKWRLQYVVKHDKAGHAESYFSPSDSQHWYWALDGFKSNGDLWVTLLCIRHAAKPSPWAMDFETCGSDLARVSHLDRDPQDWDVKISPLVADGVKSYPSATTVVSGKYAYLFSLYETGSRPLQATRIPLSGLNDPKAHLEYLAEDGTWKPGFDPTKAKAVMKNGITELSIRYHPERKQWVAVMFEPAGFSSKVLLRTAPELIGPWTEGDVIYQVPEMQPGPGYDKNTFCYAAKEHPEFEAGDLLFTYVCNTMDVPSLVTNQKIYFPQVVRMPMPE
jgi:Domain of unknown function (DUF4185)